ncbi:MAG: ATP-binding protein [Rhodospirillales bacterium]
MPPIAYTHALRIVRPLLGVPPAPLRATLRAAGLDWVEDPSNRNPAALRARIRAALADPAGTGPDIAAQATDAQDFSAARAATDAKVAAELAARATIHPEGYARLPPELLSPDALSALIRALSGAHYPPDRAAVARLAAHPAPAVLAGLRLMPAGRLGPGWLLVREQSAMQPPIPAAPGVLWDRRFRLAANTDFPAGATIGPLGADAAKLRRATRLPSAVLATLPAIRAHGTLAAVPHIGYPAQGTSTCAPMFYPAVPAAGAPFGV